MSPLALTLTRPIVALDLETTSNNPREARIVQLAFVEIFPDGHEKTWSHRFNPGVPIPPDATAVHGLTDADVAQEPAFKDAAANLAKGFTGVDFLGYNVAYDLEVLDWELQRVGVTTWSYSVAVIVDALRLWQVLEPRTLTDAVTRWVGKAPDGMHDAMIDVHATISVLQGQLATLKDRRPPITNGAPVTPQQLSDLISPPVAGAVDRGGRIIRVDGQLVANFGKHSGTPLAQIDRSYLEWIVGKSTMHPDVKRTVAQFLKGQS